MRCMIDIECDRLDTDTAVLWCIVCIDIDTNHVYKFTKENLSEFLLFAKDVTLWSGHNILSYDIPILRRYFPAVDFSLEKLEDTMILSQMVDPTIRGGHSLGAWGQRLKCPKYEFNDFSKYTEEMLEYCVQDVLVNLKLRTFLLQYLKNFSKESVALEHAVSQVLIDQRKHGFFIDKAKVDELYVLFEEKIAANELLIKEHFPDKRIQKKSNWMPRRNKLGGIYATDQRTMDKYETVVHGDGTVDCYESVPFNYNSPVQIIERLNSTGWNPVVFTKTGQPSAVEDNFNTIPAAARNEGIDALIELKILTKRRSVLDGWLKAYNPETGAIHGRVVSCGAKTHRMAHMSPQMGNIPAVRNPYGEEMRSCWTVDNLTDYTMLGCDISGIQLALLAHYMEDEAYIDAVANGKSADGTDVHTVNMKALQAAAPATTRDHAKTFIYALIFGAGDARLGKVLGISGKAGGRAKAELFERFKGFKRVERLCEHASKQGYLRGLDGRAITVQDARTVLPAMLQGGEAVIMKKALVLAAERGVDIDWAQMMVVHDEIQCKVRRDQAEALGTMLVGCIEDAGKHFNLNIPITGEYKIGDTWSETH